MIELKLSEQKYISPPIDGTQIIGNLLLDYSGRIFGYRDEYQDSGTFHKSILFCPMTQKFYKVASGTCNKYNGTKGTEYA